MILAFACPSISEAHYSCNTACLAIFYIAYIFFTIFPNTAGNDFFVHCRSSARDNHVLRRKFLSDIFVYVVVFIKKKGNSKKQGKRRVFQNIEILLDLKTKKIASRLNLIYHIITIN